MNIYKTSRTNVINPNTNDRFVYLLESENPEEALSAKMRAFLRQVGYSDLFPNFDNIRVGTVHPFAILLAQEVLGENQKTNVFPAITIVDSALQQDTEVLGDEYSLASWSAEDIVNIEGYRAEEKVFISDDGLTRVKEVVSAQGNIAGVTRQYHTSHNMDFNVWSENKEVTSFLFDMVCHFVTQLRNDIHTELGYDMAGINGRRSGDINLDFGKLLYGANVTVSVALNHRATLFDTSVVNISTIDTQTLPEYFTLGAISG